MKEELFSVWKRTPAGSLFVSSMSVFQVSADPYGGGRKTDQQLRAAVRPFWIPGWKNVYEEITMIVCKAADRL
jgi:hypothetical protein